MSRIEEMERELRNAQAASGQGSYERRQPNPLARAQLVKVRRQLVEALSEKPDDVRVLLLLASSEEALLNYPATVSLLERASQLLPGPDRRVLKQLARSREYARFWTELRLAPAELEGLGRFLRLEFLHAPCDASRRLTERWIAVNRPGEVDDILRGLESGGGYCDCEVLANVAK